jgi:hypothetical protein
MLASAFTCPWSLMEDCLFGMYMMGCAGCVDGRRHSWDAYTHVPCNCHMFTVHECCVRHSWCWITSPPPMCPTIRGSPSSMLLACLAQTVAVEGPTTRAVREIGAIGPWMVSAALGAPCLLGRACSVIRRRPTSLCMAHGTGLLLPQPGLGNSLLSKLPPVLPRHRLWPNVRRRCGGGRPCNVNDNGQA